MLRFGDEFYLFPALNAMLLKYRFERTESISIDDEQLMFIELDFQRDSGFEDGNACVPVITQKIFVLPEHALKDWEVDMLSVEIGMMGVLSMACFEYDVDHCAQRVHEIHEDFKQLLPRDCSHENGDSASALFSYPVIMTVSLLWNDFPVIRRPDRFGQLEVAITVDREKSLEVGS